MTQMRKSILPLLLSLIAAAAGAQTIAVHGWIDGYYAWNDRRPESRLNFFSGVGTAAHRADRLDLNVAGLEVSGQRNRFAFHVVLVGGDSSDVVHAGEPHPHRRPIRNLYQASLAYTAPLGRGLSLEAGVYPSHIGFEGFFTKDNWNYTRSWLGELSPYYQTGVKASYAWSDRWSGQVHVLRGWQLVGDNNSAPAVGTQIAYNGARLSASFNTFAGPELPDDNVHLRKFGDLVASWKATPKLTVGTQVDRGRQERGDHPAANWFGVAAYGRYALDDRRAVGIRSERFRDADAGISGLPQTLTESTLTYELRPRAHLIFKFEARRDHSTQFVFNGSRSQTLAIASAVAAF